jgi:hypothetical protein
MVHTSCGKSLASVEHFMFMAATQRAVDASGWRQASGWQAEQQRLAATLRGGLDQNCLRVTSTTYVSSLLVCIPTGGTIVTKR